MSEYQISSPVQTHETRQEPRQDARDLLALLYREIGISAVSAALQMRDQPAPPRVIDPRDVPAILRGEDLAA